MEFVGQAKEVEFETSKFSISGDEFNLISTLDRLIKKRCGVTPIPVLQPPQDQPQMQKAKPQLEEVKHGQVEAVIGRPLVIMRDEWTQFSKSLEQLQNEYSGPQPPPPTSETLEEEPMVEPESEEHNSASISEDFHSEMDLVVTPETKGSSQVAITEERFIEDDVKSDGGICEELPPSRPLSPSKSQKSHNSVSEAIEEDVKSAISYTPLATPSVSSESSGPKEIVEANWPGIPRELVTLITGFHPIKS